MIRKDAVKIVCKYLKEEIIVSANGFISRDVYTSLDKNTNFYMIGSMGLASSIGLGIALRKPKKRVFVFDGDGNILMNLGSLVTIGSLQPKNLVHIIFDNSSHESTGGQPTNSGNVKIKKIALGANYTVYEIKTEQGLMKILKKIKKDKGPVMLIIKIETLKIIGKRITHKPIKIKENFMNSLGEK